MRRRRNFKLRVEAGTLNLALDLFKGFGHKQENLQKRS